MVRMFLKVLVFSYVLSSCGTEPTIRNSTLSDTQGASAAEWLEMGKDAKSLGDKAWDMIPTGTMENVRKLACSGSLGFSLRDIDGLEVSVGIDPMKRFPGVGRMMGTQASLTYSFFKQPDGSLVGQGYITPKLKLGYTVSAVDAQIGWTWGCNGNPQARTGYFAGASVGGISAGFGVDAVAAFSAPMIDDEDRPKTLYSIKKDWIAKGRSLAAKTARFYQNESLVKDYQSSNYFYTSASRKLIDQAIYKSATTNFITNDKNRRLSLSSVLTSHIKEQPIVQSYGRVSAALDLMYEIQRDLSQANSTELGGLMGDMLSSRMAEVFNDLEEVSSEIFEIYLPVFVFSRSWNVGQTKFTDILKNRLDAVQAEQGYYTRKWLEDALYSYKYFFEGVRAAKLLLNEYRIQIARDGYVNANQTIGGIHTGEVFHGCNNIAMNPNGLRTYAGLMSTPFRGSAAALSPLRTMATLTKLPFKTLGSIFKFRELITKSVKASGGKLNESTANLSYSYVIPGTSFVASNSNVPGVAGASSLASKGIGLVKKFFDMTCPAEQAEQMTGDDDQQVEQELELADQ
jgi:hypothetical protein